VQSLARDVPSPPGHNIDSSLAGSSSLRSEPPRSLASRIKLQICLPRLCTSLPSRCKLSGCPSLCAWGGQQTIARCRSQGVVGTDSEAVQTRGVTVCQACQCWVAAVAGGYNGSSSTSTAASHILLATFLGFEHNAALGQSPAVVGEPWETSQQPYRQSSKSPSGCIPAHCIPRRTSVGCPGADRSTCGTTEISPSEPPEGTLLFFAVIRIAIAGLVAGYPVVVALVGNFPHIVALPHQASNPLSLHFVVFRGAGCRHRTMRGGVYLCRQIPSRLRIGRARHTHPIPRLSSGPASSLTLFWS